MMTVVSQRWHLLCFLVLFFSVALLGASLLPAKTGTAEKTRPNFLIIVTDDQGWWDLACHGNPVLKTPHMDKLGTESVEFQRFYASPVCSLTRASLFTGRYPLRTGCYDTRFGHDTLGKNEVTMGDVLKNAGYKTALFGKWHQGRYMGNHPNNRGFDEYFGFWQYGHVERYFFPDRLWHNQERVEARGHITDLFTDAAIDYLKSSQGPFCCVVTYNVPHFPFQALPELTQAYTKQGVPLEDAEIYGLVEQCDADIGRLLSAVDKQGLKENTVVVFLSDNGGISKFYRAGLRGSKGNVYQGGILTPCFVRYPNHFPAGARIKAQCDVVDLLPTVADLAGAEMPHDRAIDGVSLRPLLETGKGKSPHEYLFHNWSRNRPRDDVNWAITATKYKLVNNQLYDIDSDPGESHNLAASQPDVVKRLRTEYVNWFKEVCAGQNYGRVPIEVGRSDENPVELQMSWAELHGAETSYKFSSYDWDSVEGWNKPGDAADWDIIVARPGKYEITVQYGCARADAGGAFLVSAGSTKIHGQVESTPTADVYIKRTLGVMELAQGPTTVRVEAQSIPGKQLMALNRLWLKRID